MNSLKEEKVEVIRLRCLLERETNPLIRQQIAFKLAYARLEHDIVECGVLEPERIERLVERTEKAKARAYKSVKYAAIAIILAVVVWLVVGCHTVSGFGRDLSAVSSPYIQEK